MAKKVCFSLHDFDVSFKFQLIVEENRNFVRRF